MEMFLTVLCMSLLSVGVSAALFAAATADDRRREALPLDSRLTTEATPRFFAVAQPVVPPPVGAIPVDVLLLRLEQHMRLEQAAAESFHQLPTPASLHVRTMSPLVH